MWTPGEEHSEQREPQSNVSEQGAFPVCFRDHEVGGVPGAEGEDGGEGGVRSEIDWGAGQQGVAVHFKDSAFSLKKQKAPGGFQCDLPYVSRGSLSLVSWELTEGVKGRWNLGDQLADTCSVKSEKPAAPTR